IASNLGLQFDDVNEYVSLTAQFIRDHRRLRGYRRDDGDTHALALYGFDPRAEISVAREQHHVVNPAGTFHVIDRPLPCPVPFDLAAPGLVDELLGSLGHD